MADKEFYQRNVTSSEVPVESVKMPTIAPELRTILEKSEVQWVQSLVGGDSMAVLRDLARGYLERA